MKEQNADVEFRVGLKALDDLYPSRIRDKVVAEKKLKKWDDANKRAIFSVAKAQEEFDVKNPTSQNFLLKEKLEKEDLDAKMEFLSSYEKKYSDVKTTYDIVLYESDSGWVAIIDTTESVSLICYYNVILLASRFLLLGRFR